MTKPSILGGTLIVAGTTIGAGMLALPTISAGMWTGWSIVVMIATWRFMLWSSQALLEVNLHFNVGDSFSSLVKNTLGTTWDIINGIAVAFVSYILLYAYISGGTSTVVNSIESSFGIGVNSILIGILFVLFLAGIVWVGTACVDRFSMIMVIGLVVSFVLSMSGLTFSVSLDNLFDSHGQQDGRVIFLWVALSTYLTSFNFHSSVPSLVKYFGKEPLKINKCFVYGTLIAFIVYTVWVLIAHGLISRETFKQVIHDGGNVGVLLKAAGQGVSNQFITKALDMFAFLALTTSFLGVGLGFFDYIADLMKFDDSLSGRTKTALITFVPPMIGGVFFPDGFVSAIAWAGVFSIVWAVLIPASMLLVVRKKYGMLKEYQAYKGNWISYLLLVYSILAGICHILGVFNILPTYS